MKKDFKSLTEAEYRAYNLESYSSLKYLLSSVSSFIKAGEDPFTGNIYTLLGTAIHNCLQGCKHLIKYEPYIKTKDDPEDLIVVPGVFKEKLDSVTQNLSEHPEVLDILLHPKVKFEVPYISSYKKLKYKAKLDIVLLDRIGEIKTSSKAFTLELFRKEAYERHYDLQAAMYIRAAKVKKHFFIVVNTAHPYDISYYPTSETFLKSGLVKLEKIEKLYRLNILEGNSESDSEV